ncbi:MAG: DUF3187 family protein [Treponema sp.]|nr:DUF3187 family protein [Treponema sp.]
MSKLKILLLVQLCVFNATALYPADTETDFSDDFSKGPLFGKNMYIPFLIHYNFPSLPAKSGERFDLQYHFSWYYIQDAHYAPNDLTQYEGRVSRRYDLENVLRDYEGCVGEVGFAYHFLENMQAGIDMRIIAYYGGFLDPAFEFFHNAFDFMNGGREFFLQNQLYINIPNNNGIRLFLDKPAVSFGDIDVWGKWTFFENANISLATLGAFKLPTGRLETLSGSGYPDLGLGLLSDIRATRLLTLYAQAGVVLPFNMKSYPMFNGLAGLEIHPWEPFSFIIQMNIKTSPIYDNTIEWTWNPYFGTYFAQYSLPQTNLLAGFVIKHKSFRWQVYFEEDTITNQGTDLTINVMFSHSLSLKNMGVANCFRR